MRLRSRRLGGPWAVTAGVLAAVLCAPGGKAQGAAGATVPAQGGSPAAPGQSGGRRGQYAGMARAMGEVTAVSGAVVTLKAQDGSTVQVVTTDNTRVMKERGPVRVTDLHPGDGLMAVGNMDATTKTLHAAMIFAEDAAQVKAMRENLGKTYITGRVTAVNLDDARMTVERADHVAQTIGFDDTTSFKRAVHNRGGGNGGAGGNANGSGSEDADGGSGPSAGHGPGGGSGFGGGIGGIGGMTMGNGIERAFNNGESITLVDIKVGDYVAGTGSVKNGTFVPVHLLDSPPGQRRQRNNGGPGAGGAFGSTPQAGAGASPEPGGL